MDNLRFIVNELNKLFDSDYNMISFGSLSDTELLEVLMNVLSYVGATAKIDVQKNKEQSIMNILMALQSIKYTPEQDIPSSEFREGLIMGRRNIIHPILFWILSNIDKVKQRVYFATFVEKVELPPELLGDPEIEQMCNTYEKLIEEFWICYNENSKEKKNAAESTELQEDTKKMSADMSYLMQRLEIQSEKLKNVPNREGLINSVRSNRSEVKQKEKLTDQLRDQKNILVQMNSDIKSLQSTLNQNSGRRPENMDPIQQIREEVQINKILMEGQLPREQEEIILELKAFEKVVQDGEPLHEDMQTLNSEMEDLSQKVQALLNKKLTLTNTNDDQLLPFRNQATIIANKKQELSNFIMKVKTKNDTVLEQINQKLGTLRELIGGDLLHGDELKVFINNLRDRSNFYKKCRSYLQSLQSMTGTATRTLEILQLEDPTVAEALRLAKEKPKSEESPQTDDISEIKFLCKKLYQETNQIRAESSRLYDEVVQMRADFEEFNDKFYVSKREFDNATDNISDAIEKLEQSFEDLEEDIKKGENEWKEITKSVEGYEILIQKYSEEVSSTLGGSNIIQQLTGKLRVHEKTKKDLQNRIEKLQKLKESDQAEIEQLKRIKQMILYKLQ